MCSENILDQEVLYPGAYHTTCALSKFVCEPLPICFTHDVVVVAVVV